MRLANIKVWVLTGDKVDTAKNIGYSCRLLVHEGMDLVEYPKNFDIENLLPITQDLEKRQKDLLNENLKVGFLVTGHILDTIMAKGNEGSDLRRLVRT